MLDRRKNKIIVVAVTVCVSLFCTKSMSAQQIGIKTNILYDASATINMGGSNLLLRPNGHWTYPGTGTAGISRTT